MLFIKIRIWGLLQNIAAFMELKVCCMIYRQVRQVLPLEYYNLTMFLSTQSIMAFFSTSVTLLDDHKALLQTINIISLNVNHSTLFALLALI